MLIDLEAKEVTFFVQTTLTLDQLWSLIDLLDDGDDEPEEPEDEHPEWVLPTKIVLVPSETTVHKEYCVVKLEDGSYACSCYDYIMRKHKTGAACKHILRALYWYF